MKKLTLMMVALLISVAASAQFEQGKKYVGASLTGLNLSYSGSEKGHLGVMAKGGYLLSDNLMATGWASYETQTDISDALTVGAGGRYYIIQNGLFLGAGVTFKHAEDYNHFMPTVQVGYAFFLNGSVTVEPEIYYEQSFKNHKDFSKIGFRIGLGIYL